MWRGEKGYKIIPEGGDDLPRVILEKLFRMAPLGKSRNPSLEETTR